MNIKELAEQAGFEEQTHFIDSWECGLKEMERFAELVRQDYLRELQALKPVAWMLPEYGDVLPASQADGTGIYNIPLYTAPPKPEQESISTNDHLCAMLRQVHDALACTALPMKRPWVGLTDEEVEEAWGNTPIMLNARDGGSRKMFARAIETKLKEKNT